MTAERDPLLSICIPTYNRAELLGTMLENLVSQDAFRNGADIEIVISDNASTDETRAVGETYAARHPEKIRYFRNPENIQDANFGLALSRGRGVFLKLSNDTLLHSSAGLEKTLEAIRRYRAERPILCLKNGTPPWRPDTRISTLDAFWRERSFLTTWIAEFGIWREDFTSAQDFARAADTHLTQVDVLLRLMQRKRDAVVVEGGFFTGIPRKRMGVGSVNSARVFGTDYFDLLAPYVEAGEISRATLGREKWRVFRNLILPTALITRPGFLFPNDNFTHHLFKHFHSKWYFWCAIPFSVAARVIARVRRALDI